MNIFTANLEVTKATVQGGEIKELEINRQNVPLASSIAIETSKAVTIDASTYSSPVEVTPTAGKDAMKKVVVTITDVSTNPTFYAWGSGENPDYYTISATPAEGDTVHEKGYDTGEISPETAVISSTGTDAEGAYITVGESETKYYRLSDSDWTWSE